MVEVEVVYALAEQQYLLKLQLLDDSSVEQAIIASGILQRCPEIDLKKNQCGIFSKKVALEHRVHSGDRIEIYRPLTIDPKAARRIRAAKK